MIDSPTPYADGGNGRGNYCVMSPIDKASGVTLSNGNLSASCVISNNMVRGTIGMTSGKWYWEVTATSTAADIGLAAYDASINQYIGLGARAWGYYGSNGNKINNGSSTAYGSSFTTNNVIGVAFDADNGKLFFSKNNTWQNSGDPAAGTNAAFSSGLTTGPYFPAISDDTAATQSGDFNFGQRPFAYTPPSGFLALNTQNLPTPTIANGAQYMAAVTWTGDAAASRNIVPSTTNSGNNPLPTTFQPDMVWLKARNQPYDALIFDAVRLAGKSIAPSSTSAEVTNNGNGYLSAFNTDGFTVAQGSSSILSVNASGVTYVGWQWKGGGAGVVNNVGSIPSTVSANVSAGFSVATATAPASGAFSIGHGLGVTPSMIIVKPTAGGTANWAVWHTSLGSSYYINLNQTAAQTSTTYWGTMTSSLINFAATNLVNASSAFVCYTFAAVAGYSAAFSFTGNGSSDGPMVNLSFRPRWILIKRTDTTGNWIVFDTSRQTINYGTTSDPTLYPNLSIAEATGIIDILSNGFKVRFTDSDYNASGGSYIGYAIAENPFAISRAR
jgi:hypothetical protein